MFFTEHLRTIASGEVLKIENPAQVFESLFYRAPLSFYFWRSTGFHWKRLQPAISLKKRLCHICFPMNFARFLRNFFTKHLWATASETTPITIAINVINASCQKEFVLPAERPLLPPLCLSSFNSPLLKTSYNVCKQLLLNKPWTFSRVSLPLTSWTW